MGRDEAIALLEKYLKNKNLIKHSFACEAIMRRLAEHLDEDPVDWAMAGLLHDIDYELTKENPREHGLLGARLLEEVGLPEAVVAAVRAHNEMTGYRPVKRIEKALWVTDPTSGFIVACVLVHPERSICKVEVPFLLSRFKEKSFARGASREQIRSCEAIGLSLEQFLEIALLAMQERAADLGL